VLVRQPVAQRAPAVAQDPAKHSLPFTHTGPSGDNSATSPVTSDKGGLLGIMGDGGPRRFWAERRHQSAVPRGGRIIRRWLGGVAPLSQAFAGQGLFILVSALDLFKAAPFFHKVTQRSAALVQLVRRFT
jgi:hypothetical protein